MAYNLARAFQLRDFFVSGNPTKNLFYYRQDSEVWLQSSERVTAFLIRLKLAFDAANNDEMFIRERRILDRSSNLANMMLGDILCAIYSEHCAPGAVNSRGQIVNPGSLLSTDAESLKQGHQDAMKEEAKGAIKDVSIMSIPYKGLVRRAYKLMHNVEVIDQLLDDRLYVPASLIRDNITDMVFKGVWTSGMQAIFNRIMKTFVSNRMWSVRGRAKKAEWDRIIADTSTVSDRPGRIFVQVVEQSLAATGIAA